jgi:hypothetical protein
MMSADATPANWLPMQSRPTLLCLQCAREMSRRAAKFHRLRCKTRAIGGLVVDGERVPEEKWSSHVEKGGEVLR